MDILLPHKDLQAELGRTVSANLAQGTKVIGLAETGVKQFRTETLVVTVDLDDQEAANKVLGAEDGWSTADSGEFELIPGDYAVELSAHLKMEAYSNYDRSSICLLLPGVNDSTGTELGRTRVDHFSIPVEAQHDAATTFLGTARTTISVDEVQKARIRIGVRGKGKLTFVFNISVHNDGAAVSIEPIDQRIAQLKAELSSVRDSFEKVQGEVGGANQRTLTASNAVNMIGEKVEVALKDTMQRVGTRLDKTEDAIADLRSLRRDVEIVQGIAVEVPNIASRVNSVEQNVIDLRRPVLATPVLEKYRRLDKDHRAVTMPIGREACVVIVEGVGHSVEFIGCDDAVQFSSINENYPNITWYVFDIQTTKTQREMRVSGSGDNILVSRFPIADSIGRSGLPELRWLSNMTEQRIGLERTQNIVFFDGFESIEVHSDQWSANSWPIIDGTCNLCGYQNVRFLSFPNTSREVPISVLPEGRDTLFICL